MILVTGDGSIIVIEALVSCSFVSSLNFHE